MNRLLEIEKDKDKHYKGLSERIPMCSNAKTLMYSTTGYKEYFFAKTGERKIDKA